MHNIIRCCTCKRKSHCRCCTFERRSRCNETFVMHECFISRSKSRVQCVNLKYLPIKLLEICWFHGSSFKGFSIVFLLSDWLKLNHLKSRMECGFSDIFSRHFCSTIAETIGVTNYAASFGVKKMFRKPHLKLLR